MFKKKNFFLLLRNVRTTILFVLAFLPHTLSLIPGKKGQCVHFSGIQSVKDDTFYAMTFLIGFLSILFISLLLKSITLIENSEITLI